MESVIADKWGINEVSALEVSPFFSADVSYSDYLKSLCTQILIPLLVFLDEDLSYNFFLSSFWAN
jgi:hypothetical protein